MAIIKNTESGAELMVNEATFEEVLELKKAVQEELKKMDYSLDKLDGSSLSYAVSNMVDLLLGMDTSERVELAIFNCLAHCTYDKSKINKQLFDDRPEARADYYEMVKECMVINLRPFMKSLSSQFPILTIFTEIYHSTLSQQTLGSE